MVLTHISTRVPADSAATARTAEPLTFGLPLPVGAVFTPDQLALADPKGARVPIQCHVAERWPSDGSVRWMLVDAQLSVPQTYSVEVAQAGDRPAHPDPVVLLRQDRKWTVVTTGMSYLLEDGSGDLFSVGGGNPRLLTVRITGLDDLELPFRVHSIAEEVTGPLRTTLRLEGSAGGRTAPPLVAVARVSWFAGSPAVRVDFTLRNPRRAEHPGGYWELGDRGSVLFRDASLVLTGAGSEHVFWSETPGARPVEVSVPTTLYQDSSGGERWRSRNHVNRDGRVPIRFRGYELTAMRFKATGTRALPVAWIADTDGMQAAVTVQDFWQNFPIALEADSSRILVRLFPAQFADRHELQGGEQKRHTVGFAFGADGVADRPLDWIARPGIASPPPEWFKRSAAVRYLAPVGEGSDPRYEELVGGAIQGPDSFEEKRERIDEYGWRNFGEIYADHESVFAPADEPIVSHYNNQYDGIAGFAIQFMRSGDARWWRAMRELARHVADIDIYHTDGDKAAYSRGLFWHTYHYKDAGRATHRCYARVEGIEGGGPSNEQNYSTGLMYSYLLTGDPAAREAAVELADWVIRMDDGHRTVFRWLSRGDTGHASSTRSASYHGPGRGAGNSMVTLLNAFRLTGSRLYLDKAEGLVRRCIHPQDDVGARDLLDAENRWSYTVFLQALGRYLDDKETLGEIDCRYAYARASLVNYARWMAEHEYPYLEKPDILEYPNETWAAQDMRKCDVFLYACRHASSEDRARFEERAGFFYRASLDWLHRFDTRVLARPVVLMLSYGFMHAGAGERGGLAPAPPAPHECDFGQTVAFVPQKQLALRRAKLLLVTAGLIGVVLAGLVARMVLG